MRHTLETTSIRRDPLWILFSVWTLWLLLRANLRTGVAPVVEESTSGSRAVKTHASSVDIPNAYETRRPWQGPPCNQVITTVSVQEIQALAQAWVDVVAPAAYLGETNTTTLHDVLVSKVCGSCSQHTAHRLGNNESTWNSYCGPHTYGYDAPHSALVFHPMDSNTQQPLKGRRRVGLGFQGTRLEISKSFSTHFPTNVTQRMQATFENLAAFSQSFVDVFPLLLAASHGMITYGTDGLGAGESANGQYNRSYLTAIPVQQATVVNYYNLRQYTKNLTHGQTEISHQLLTWGYSAGGGAVLWGAHALQQEGMQIVRTFTQAGVYQLTAFVQELLAPILKDPSRSSVGFDTAGFWALFAAAYSNEAPYLPNTGTGQTLLSPPFRSGIDQNNVLDWVFGEHQLDALELRTRYPRDGPAFLESVNHAIFHAIGTSSRVTNHSFCDEPFITAETNALCAALSENSPVAALREIRSPVEWCHSPQDQIIPFDSTRTFLLANRESHGLPVQAYEPLLPLLVPKGSHGMAQIICCAAVPTYLFHHADFSQGQPILS